MKFHENVNINSSVIHKYWGKGTVISVNDIFLVVKFDRGPEKKFFNDEFEEYFVVNSSVKSPLKIKKQI